MTTKSENNVRCARKELIQGWGLLLSPNDRIQAASGSGKTVNLYILAIRGSSFSFLRELLTLRCWSR